MAKVQLQNGSENVYPTTLKSKVLGTYATVGTIEINEHLSDFSIIVICVAWTNNYTGFGFIPAEMWNSNNSNVFPVKLNNGTDTNGVTLTYRSSDSTKFWFDVSRTHDNVNFKVVGIY